LSLEEARVFGSWIYELGEGFDEITTDAAFEATFKATLIRMLDLAFEGSFPDGAFVRLGSRSPKDSLYWGMDPEDSESGIVRNADQAIRRLISCSERVYDDLQMHLAMDTPPCIYLRKWIDIPEALEFRCFMKDRKLIGISQYYHHGVYPEVTDNLSKFKQIIEAFFAEKFLPAIHLDSVVFDVFMTGNNVRDYQTHLLEINPFYELCDPCLFDWSKPEDFQGQLRYRSELGSRGFGTKDFNG
jgi:hypothetical protein